jgi:hypothetical protein
MTNPATSGIDHAKSASIIVGIPSIGHTEGSEYQTDFGFYSFYLREPDPPTVHGSKAMFSNKVEITWVQDPLSAPAYHRDNYFGDDIFYLFKDDAFHSDHGPIDEASDFYATHDGVFYDYEVSPGTIYQYEVKSKNSFGETANEPYSEKGNDVGFVSPNGTVSGIVTTPNNNPVPGIKVRVSPNLGKSLWFQENSYAKIQDDNRLDPLDSFTAEIWFRISEEDGILINKSNAVMEKGQFQLAVSESHLRATVYDEDGTSQNLVSSESFTLGSWNYGAMVFDQGLLTIFLNENADSVHCDFDSLSQGNYSRSTLRFQRNQASARLMFDHRHWSRNLRCTGSTL